MLFLFKKMLLVFITGMSYETSVVWGSTDNDFWQPVSLLNTRGSVFIPSVDNKKYFWHYFAYTLYLKSWKLFSPIEKDKYFITERLQRMTTEETVPFGENEPLAESFRIPFFCTCEKVLRTNWASIYGM